MIIDVGGKGVNMNKNQKFIEWLKLFDAKNDCAVPEDLIPVLEEAFEAGVKSKKKKKSFDVNELYTDMPEYENEEQEKPLITATFKFATKENYEDFKEKVCKFIFNGEKVFDGMQKLDAKQSWYPHKPKASRFIYVDKGEEN